MFPECLTYFLYHRRNSTTWRKRKRASCFRPSGGSTLRRSRFHPNRHRSISLWAKAPPRRRNKELVSDQTRYTVKHRHVWTKHVVKTWSGTQLMRDLDVRDNNWQNENKWYRTYTMVQMKPFFNIALCWRQLWISSVAWGIIQFFFYLANRLTVNQTNVKPSGLCARSPERSN